MRAPGPLLVLASLALTLAGCDRGEVVPRDPTRAPTAAATVTATEGTGSTGGLVVLEADQGLPSLDNVVPVVSTMAATEPLTAALDQVSRALTTEDLVALDRQGGVEGQDPAEVASALAAQKGIGEGVQGGQGTLVVGAAGSGQSQVLAHLYAIALQGAGFTTEVTPYTDREAYGPALERGEITVFPEYVGSFTEYLDAKKDGPDAGAATGELEATVARLRSLAEEVGLTVLEPSAAAAQSAFAVTRAFAEEHDLATLSDLAAYQGELVLGGPPECPERPSCQPGLEQVYGIAFDDVVALDAGGPLTRTALEQGRIQVGLVRSSDGSVPTPDGQVPGGS